MALYTKLLLGNCLKQMTQLDDNSVDSIVTDPPYGLSFMGKKWDYDVPSVEIWSECLRVLKPGGHLLAFAGTRTQHRMAVNIEDAGFEIRDMIAWVYGSGFPKSMDISKAIDKQNGYEGKIIGKETIDVGMQGGSMHAGRERKIAERTIKELSAEAKQWEGWGTALKPALEPITVARKPIRGTVADNVLKWGTGGLNIDECRIPTSESTLRPCGKALIGTFEGQEGKISGTPAGEGRFPANLILDEEAGKILDEQSGISKSTGGRSGNKEGIWNGRYNGEVRDENPGLGDVGGASRFFYCAKASKRDRDEGCDGLGVKRGELINRVEGSAGAAWNGAYDTGNAYAGAGAPKRNHHPTVKPTDLMRYLVKLVTPPEGVVLDPFMGSGSTGKACVSAGFSFIGIEMEQEYIDIAKARIEREKRKGIQSDLF